VRFKVATTAAAQTESNVSIPKWCDLKMHHRRFLTMLKLVSIPKWCDLKNIKIIGHFS